MKIVFVSDDAPMSSNYNGAASYKYSHLKLLLQCYPEAEYTIVTLCFQKTSATAPENASELPRDYPEKVFRHIKLDLSENLATGRERKINLFSASFNRFAFFNPVISRYNIRLLQETLKKEAPDLIWTEQLLENYLVLRTNPFAPVVYSHTDFAWKIQQIRLRNGSVKKKLLNRLFRQSELAVLRRNRFVVSGSISEIQELSTLNPRLETAYLPTTYASCAAEAPPANGLPDIVHLGTLSATANKVGLERFLEVCWPSLRSLHPRPNLLVIGNTNVPRVEKIKSLLQQSGITAKGFVENLDDVLKPYDLHIIPYEYDTGTRTRLPVALNYRQLLVAHKRACQGIEGLHHLKNCLLADSLEEMTALIQDILAGNMNYKGIADRGKDLFLEQFTVQGQQQRMQSFLKRVIQR